MLLRDTGTGIDDRDRSCSVGQRQHIDAEEYNKAQEEIGKALAVNPKSAETLSLLASINFVRSNRTEFDKYVKQVLDTNPKYSNLYDTLAEACERLRLYKEAADFAATKGIIIADTKFEFGLDDQQQLVLIDEVLTADSSRFWPADSYKVGMSPPSYDKQYVRDYLETLDWNKAPPAPKLPAEVIQKTSEKYREALQRLTGRKL